MKTLAVVALIFTATTASAATGFLTGERTSGFNKICYYDVLGSTYTLNMRSTQLCPITAQF